MIPDEELAQHMKEGDSGALTALVQRHHSRLIGFLYRMTGGDRVLAEDLVQETFLRVLRSIDKYHYPRPFKAWMYAIATNLARDHYKSATVRRTVTIEEDVFNRHSEARPEDALEADDETRAVVTALFTLSEHQREVVVLRYYEELSLAEIAETLDIPVGTVKSRLSIGLSRLREAMTQERA